MAQLTQSELDQLASYLTVLAQMLSSTSGTVTLPDTTVVGNIKKQIEDALSSSYLLKGIDQDLGALLRVTNLEIHNGAAATDKKTARWVKVGSGIQLEILDDSGAVIEKGPYLGSSSSIPLGRGKTLSHSSVQHAGGRLLCGSDSQTVIGGSNIESVSRSQTGFYSAKLSIPLRDPNKAACTVNNHSAIYGLQLTSNWWIVSESEVGFNVKTSFAAQQGDPKSDDWQPDYYIDGTTVHLQVFDYS